MIEHKVKMIVSVPCIYKCGEVYDIEMTLQQYECWVNRIGLIQDVFPDLDVDSREILISGQCKKCYDKMVEDMNK